MTSIIATEIIPHLWLGNIHDSRNEEFINKIDIVINCTKDIDFINNNKVNIRLAVEDNLEKQEIINMYKYLNKITEIIHKFLLKGKTVFVHCFAGKQRSACVVCAYLMRYLSVTFNEAKVFLKSKREIVFEPLCNFEAALDLFYKKDITNTI